MVPPRALSIVPGALLTAMATPHHLARSLPDGGAEMASAALSAPSQPAPATPRLPTPPQTARRSLRRAVWRNPKQELATQSLCSWRASESGQHGSTAAQHIARCALLSDGCMLSRARLPHSLPARPLARHTLWRTHPQRHKPPRLSLPRAAALSRTSACTLLRGATRIARSPHAQFGFGCRGAVESDGSEAYIAQHPLPQPRSSPISCRLQTPESHLRVTPRFSLRGPCM